mgnify:CR=1 FL=1
MAVILTPPRIGSASGASIAHEGDDETEHAARHRGRALALAEPESLHGDKCIFRASFRFSCPRLAHHQPDNHQKRQKHEAAAHAQAGAD